MKTPMKLVTDLAGRLAGAAVDGRQGAGPAGERSGLGEKEPAPRASISCRPPPDWFAQLELAVDRAVRLNTDPWAASLFDYSTVAPPAAELRAVRQAHTRATALGLWLPPYPKTTVRFVLAPVDCPTGGQTRSHDDVIEMA
jgi:hypothetical protein